MGVHTSYITSYPTHKIRDLHVLGNSERDLTKEKGQIHRKYRQWFPRGHELRKTPGPGVWGASGGEMGVVT